MALFLCLCLFVTTALLTTVFGYTRFVKPSKILDQLASAKGDFEYLTKVTNAAATRNVFTGLISAIGKLIPISPQDIDMKRRELASAGYRSADAVAIFMGIKVVSCAGLLILAMIWRNHLSDNALNRLAIPIAAASAGFLLPGFVLGQMAKKRREKIRLALPDVLDLLVISTEAGCALDRSMLNVSSEFKSFHPAISEELTLINMEMLAGGSRVDALRNFARRTGEEEVKKLVAILVQTDRFGTSVAEALRTQSEFMRVRRRQIAEEKAGKVGVKLVFPIFFFCMPSLTILVAGPGLLQLFKSLLPTLNSMH